MSTAPNQFQDKKIIFVLGATATGKSSQAIKWAAQYNGSIVNIDSIQFYKGIEIGSASPTQAEKKLVPHHLYNYVDAPQELTAGDFIRDFYLLLEKSPQFPLFIVGGTGFYIQALEKGMYDLQPLPEGYRQSIETELHEGGPQKLWDELTQADPEHKIHLNDHYRLVRAIEVLRFFGQTPTEMKQDQTNNKNKLQHPFIKVGFKKEKTELLKNVIVRTEKMMEEGLIEEVRNMLDQGHESWAPLASVGLKETVEMIQQQQSKEWLSEQITSATMKLIKKQNTWFSRDASILWSQHEESLKRFLQPY